MTRRRPPHRPRRRRSRGAVTLAALLVALTVSGLSFALLSESVASTKFHTRSESNLRSVEAAETGICRAEEEISSKIDTGSDGIGNLAGSFAGGTFQVGATKDPAYTNRWSLRATGGQGASSRRIEVGVRRVPIDPWSYGAFGGDTVDIGAVGASSDSYDSRLGTYASQATNVDADGAYAQTSGLIGSDGPIALSGTARIRGDSVAGPGYATSLSGSASVTGDLTPFSTSVDLAPTPYAEFNAAATTNDDGAWTTTGGTTWDATTLSLHVVGGNTLTLTGSTYFFSNVVFTGGSTLEVTGGPVKLYVTDLFDLGAGTLGNRTGKPVNVQIYAYPYALPTGYTPTQNKIVLSGGSDSAFAIYAPVFDVTLLGSGDFFGTAIGKTYAAVGGAKLHYDIAIGEQLGSSAARITRLYWRDLVVPRR